jgi:hypothetical protein
MSPIEQITLDEARESGEPQKLESAKSIAERCRQLFDDAKRRGELAQPFVVENVVECHSEYDTSLKILCAAIQTGKYVLSNYHQQAELVRVSREIYQRFIDSFTTSDKATDSSQQPATPAP